MYTPLRPLSARNTNIHNSTNAFRLVLFHISAKILYLILQQASRSHHYPRAPRQRQHATCVCPVALCFAHRTICRTLAGTAPACIYMRRWCFVTKERIDVAFKHCICLFFLTCYTDKGGANNFVDRQVACHVCSPQGDAKATKNINDMSAR